MTEAERLAQALDNTAWLVGRKGCDHLDQAAALLRSQAAEIASAQRCCDSYAEENQRLSDKIDAQAAEIEALRALLRDPVAVHVAMLRGDIARPPLRDFLHVGGEKELADYDAMRADAERWRWLADGTQRATLRIDFDPAYRYVRHRVTWYEGDEWRQSEGQSAYAAIDAARQQGAKP